MPTHRELLAPIINEMLTNDQEGHVTSQDIADEVFVRAGMRFTAGQVSAIRNQVGMGYRQMFQRDWAMKALATLDEMAQQIRKDYGL